MSRFQLTIRRAAAIGALVLSCSLTGCGDFGGGPSGPARVDREGASVTITDRSGKVWDVAHAEKYGLRPDGFQFGLGPGAIPPINGPEMSVPGDGDYPSDTFAAVVMGVSMNGIVRAYSLNVMSRHEVANEVFGEAHVAVAY